MAGWTGVGGLVGVSMRRVSRGLVGATRAVAGMVTEGRLLVPEAASALVPRRRAPWPAIAPRPSHPRHWLQCQPICLGLFGIQAFSEHKLGPQPGCHRLKAFRIHAYRLLCCALEGTWNEEQKIYQTQAESFFFSLPQTFPYSPLGQALLGIFSQ